MHFNQQGENVIRSDNGGEVEFYSLHPHRTDRVQLFVSPDIGDVDDTPIAIELDATNLRLLASQATDAALFLDQLRDLAKKESK